VDKFAKSYTDVLQKVIASPVFIAYFWIRVAKMLHWTALARSPSLASCQGAPGFRP